MKRIFTSPLYGGGRTVLDQREDGTFLVAIETGHLVRDRKWETPVATLSEALQLGAALLHIPTYANRGTHLKTLLMEDCHPVLRQLRSDVAWALTKQILRQEEVAGWVAEVTARANAARDAYDLAKNSGAVEDVLAPLRQEQGLASMDYAAVHYMHTTTAALFGWLYSLCHLQGGKPPLAPSSRGGPGHGPPSTPGSGDPQTSPPDRRGRGG